MLKFCQTVDGIVAVTNILFEAILEINQEWEDVPGGQYTRDLRPTIIVPEVLKPYMGGKDKIVPPKILKYWYAGRYAGNKRPGKGGVFNDKGAVFKSNWPGYESWEHDTNQDMDDSYQEPTLDENEFAEELESTED